MKPMGGKAKAYILDESHQLTAAAQEALLKTLEETPNHVYFFMCTTDPDAIIKTIRNRCTELAVSPLGQEDIFNVLYDACESQNITIADELLLGIIENSEGSSRKALVFLELLSETDSVEEGLEILNKGTKQDAKIIDLCKSMYMGAKQRRKKWKYIIRTFDSLDAEPEKIRRSILGFLYHHLADCDDEDEAMDIANLLHIFSVNVYYGGKSLLGAQIARACFETNNF
jgi:DNA polymerase III gamma/tau subunit